MLVQRLVMVQYWQPRPDVGLGAGAGSRHAATLAFFAYWAASGGAVWIIIGAVGKGHAVCWTLVAGTIDLP